MRFLLTISLLLTVTIVSCGGGGGGGGGGSDPGASGGQGNALSGLLPGSVAAGTSQHALLAWNDLGMHCMDRDFSIFSILPPYNNLHAQLIDRTSGRAVTSGVTITYEAAADSTGSIN
jgi:hypothetical protein